MWGKIKSWLSSATTDPTPTATAAITGTEMLWLPAKAFSMLVLEKLKFLLHFASTKLGNTVLLIRKAVVPIVAGFTMYLSIVVIYLQHSFSFFAKTLIKLKTA
jgi:hypothetical protein